jgi:hypothetical protein
VTVAIAANALTLLATIKSELGITASTDDDYLQRAINFQSTNIENLLNRKLHAETLTESVKAVGTRRLILSRRPIISITSLAYNTLVIDASLYTAENEQGTIFAPNGFWAWDVFFHADAGADVNPGTEWARWVAVYKGGYVLPYEAKDADAGPPAVAAVVPTLPADLEQLCLWLVCDQYNRRAVSRDVTNERIDVVSVNYRDGLPAEYKAILDSYRERI